MENKLFDSINMKKIEQIAKLVSDNELSEITLSAGDCKLTVKGKKPQPVIPAPMGITAPVQQTSSAPSQTVSEPIQQETVGNVVKSPIVGTFYQAPSPDKPPFVKIGDTVKKGDVIMIIESMKLMNEVQSEFSGVVEKIFVTDGQAVEYDQPIMVIK